MWRDRPDKFEKIVTYRGSHLRVLAAPGSGKTSLLRDRYRCLTENAAGNSSAAVLTYTRRSQSLLTADLLGKNTSRLGRTPVYTYHQLALEILSAVPSASRRLLSWIAPL